MNNTEYILQKDSPDAKAGTVLRLARDGDTYDYISTNGEPSWYRRAYVEDNEEWFLPQKQPVFKTEDGKDICLKDKYWVVCLGQDYYCYESVDTFPITNKKWFESTKTFSTEKAAREWIVLNKPVLSVNDIRVMLMPELDDRHTSSLDYDFYFSETKKHPLYDKIKQLAQSKINKP